jgi:hypothetical protein
MCSEKGETWKYTQYRNEEEEEEESLYVYIYEESRSAQTIIRTFAFHRHLKVKSAHLVSGKAKRKSFLPVIILAIACIKLITMTMQPNPMHT